VLTLLIEGPNKCYINIDAINMKFMFTSKHIEMLKNTMYRYVKQRMLLVYKKSNL